MFRSSLSPFFRHRRGTHRLCNGTWETQNITGFRGQAPNTIDWLKPTGPAVGLTRSAVFGTKEFPFSPGDLLLLYTDGLVEARNPQDEEFGKERLETYVKEHVHQPADTFLSGLRQAAKDFAGEFHDDVTLVVIKCQ
ncbi:MAG: serine/threonine-protein phosphatase [bacterium]|nr:serine/threonine-protein phosphatase [bacterium]